MKVEIWSDIMCPFCYLGKRKFEKALAQFPENENIQIEWKSFQLNPSLQTDPNTHIDEYLANAKGISLEQAKEMNQYVTDSAKREGLTYNFDKAVLANSFNAHRMLHFAKGEGKQGEAKERLLQAYFTEGRNIDDLDTLVELGAEIGLNKKALTEALQSKTHADSVETDIYEAQQLGIRGVPFFVFDRKYGVSGAQESPVFLQTLEKSFAEWKEAHPQPKMEVKEGESCSPEGDCN